MSDAVPNSEPAGVITRAAMFERLLTADPSFRSTYEAFLEEWDRERELPQYIAISELARHLIGQLERDDTASFEAVFEVVEAWHIDGDPYVREAATIGLLEDLQNLSLHTATKPAQFLPWLRPESRRWWDKVEAFWERGEAIVKDVSPSG